MKTRWLVWLVCLSTCLPGRHGRAADDNAKSELQGKWKVVTAKQNGGSFPKEMIADMFVVFDQDEMRVYVEGTKSEQGAKFGVDDEKDPKEIDFIQPTSDRYWYEGKLMSKLFHSWIWKGDGPVPADDGVEGIYKLEGNKLTLCWRTTKAREIRGNKVSQELELRPTLFQSHLYYHQFLFVLERAKAGERTAK